MTEYKYYTGTSIKATTGLIAAYNMIPSNGTLIDISDNDNDGTINGAISTKDGLKFDGVNDSISIGDIGNIRSIAMRIKLNSTSEKILEGQANDKLIYTNSGTLTYSDFDNCFINGSDSDTISAGIWHDVVITSTTDVDMSATTLALNDTAYGNFEIADIRFYNKELSVSKIKDYHNSFVKPYLLEDMSNHSVGETIPKGWTKGTGEYEVKELTSYINKDLDIGTKYLECTSNGTISIAADLDNFVDNGYIYIDRHDGSSWTRYEDTVSDLSTDESWFDYSNKKITLTGTTGDRFTNIKIYNGVKQ